MLLLFFWFLSTFTAHAEPLYFHVSGISEQPLLELHVAGKIKPVLLLPNGQKQWTGVANEPYRRFLHIQLRSSKTQKTVYQNILVQKPQESQIFIGADASGKRFQSYSSAGVQSAVVQKEGTWTLYRGLWFLLAFSLSWAFITAASRLPAAEQKSLPWWSDALFFAVLSVLWNGSSLWTAGIPGVHYDTLGTYWFMAMSPQWSSLFDPTTSWPMGADYGRSDSFVLLLISLIFNNIPTDILFKSVVFLGPALSGWAASRLAVQLGAKQPWSWLAGMAYAFNGLAAATLLEGHIYHLLQPWLPLCGLFWWRANHPQGKPRDAVFAGLFWTLCLLTSAYIGLSASILLAGIWLGRRGWRFQASFWGFGVVAITLLFYLFLYVSGDSISGGRDYYSMMVGATNLSNFLGHGPEVDHALNSQALGVLALPLCLALFSSRLLPARIATPLWFTAVASLSLAFGSFLTTDSITPLLPMPLFFFADLPLLDSIGFPVRLAWPFLLCVGVLAALVLSRAAASKRYAWGILLLCCGEIFISTMLPWRQKQTSLELPEVYSHANGPVLDLYPEILSRDRHSDLVLWFSSTSCLFQTAHRKAIADNCVSTDSDELPRVELSRWFANMLMTGKATAAKAELEKRGFAAITLFPDLYSEGDRARIVAAMQAIDPAPTSSNNAGIFAQLYQLRPQAIVLESLPQTSQSTTWGYTALQETSSLELEFLPIDGFTFDKYQVVINGETYPFPRRRTTASFFTRIAEPMRGEVKVQIVSESIVWEGSFFPAAKHERLTIVEGEGWRFYTPVSAESPSIQGAGKAAAFLWGLALLLFIWSQLKSHRQSAKRLIVGNQNQY